MMNAKVFDPTALGLDVGRISGNEAYCVCPYHNDHKPSASFNIITGKFFCFVCGVSPTAWQIAQDLGGNVQRIFVENLVVHDSSDEWSTEWKWVLSCKKAIDNAYLASRGITNSLVNQFDIREFPKGIAFILKNDRGMPVGAQVRMSEASPGSRYLTLGDKPPLWPFEKLGKSSQNSVILVEGIFGVLNAAKAKHDNVFAILGSQSVASAIPFIRGFRKKVVVFDNDLAGHVAAAKAMVCHNSIRAFMPGAEADEVDPSFFDKVFDARSDTISYYEEVYRFAARPQEVRRLVNRFILKQFKRDRMKK